MDLSHLAGARSISVRNSRPGAGALAGGVQTLKTVPVASLGRSRSPSPTASITSGEAGSETNAKAEDLPYRNPEGTYEGESNMNLVPHGYGTYYYKNGDVFAGNWNNGIREGSGTMTYITRERYTGNYTQSLANHLGKYEFKNGDVYTGEFKMGKIHGSGVYSYSDGSIYTGKFRNGTKCDTHGVFKYANGDKYMGRFHANAPYGRGKLFLARQMIPKEVWNGKLIETDPRPSQNGAYTNFDEKDDVPVLYPDSDSEDSFSDDGEGDDDSTVSLSYRSGSTNPSQVFRYSAVNGQGASKNDENLDAKGNISGKRRDGVSSLVK
jgi:hypothetical protein